MTDPGRPSRPRVMRLAALFSSACTSSEPSPPPTSPAPEVRVEVISLEVADAPSGIEHDRLVVLTLTGDAPAALLCRAEDEPGDRILLESEATTVHELRLQGLRADTAYTCAAGPVGVPDAGAAEPFTVQTAPPVAFAPEVEVTLAPGAARPGGWLLGGFLTEGCKGDAALALFDPAGRVRWYHRLHDAEMGMEVQHVGAGVIVYGGSTPKEGAAAVHLWDGPRWTADLPGEGVDYHHDGKQLADGRVLVLQASETTDGERTWRGFRVSAFDPATMEVGWSWDGQSGHDQGALPAGFGDAWHPNWVGLLDHGQGPRLYVSLCALRQVLSVNAETGLVDWVFGAGGDFELVDPTGAPLGDDQFPQCQHGLDPSADGTRLLVYDNGRDRAESRVAEYLLDHEARRATLAWTWTDGWQGIFFGDADPLPDGSVLVTQGHALCGDSTGERTVIVKLDPEHHEQWRWAFVDPRIALNRSELLDGCEVLAHPEQCPALEPRWAELAASFGWGP